MKTTKTIIPMLPETPQLDQIPLINWMEIQFYKPLQKREIKKLLDNHVWITADKRKLFVHEMRSSHIRNCIRCWTGIGKRVIPNGYLGGKTKWLEIFENELTRRQ